MLKSLLQNANDHIIPMLLVLTVLVAVQVAFGLVRSLYRGIAQRQVWPILRDRFLVRWTFVKVVLCGGLYFVCVPFVILLKELAQETRVRTGLPAPDFSAVTLDGSTITLSEYRGKYVLLDFWHTRCGPCIRDIPDLLELHQKFEEDLVIIGVNNDLDRREVAEFVRQHEMPWIQVLDRLDNRSNVRHMYDLSSWPSYVLVDREGNVVRTNKTHDRLERVWLEDVALKLYRILPIAAANPAEVSSQTHFTEELSYQVHFTEEEMTLDGRADEKSWGLAPPIELTDRMIRSLEPIRPASTSVRALWNERGLLVLYQCQDQDILATHTERDGPVYEDDDVELFLDPDMDGIYYVQLAINAMNTQMDALCVSPVADHKRTWDSGAESGVAVSGSLQERADQDESWTVELLLPWSGMHQAMLDASNSQRISLKPVPPEAGDKWKGNFNRFDYGRETIVSGWGVSPYYSSFHEPGHWGVLVFVK